MFRNAAFRQSLILKAPDAIRRFILFMNSIIVAGYTSRLTFTLKMRSAVWAAALFFIVFVVHSLCPIGSMFDSRWTIPVALSLLDRGDTNIDEYRALIEKDEYYAVECVESGRTISFGKCKGHYYNWYPVAVPVLASPVVFTLRKAVLFLSPLLARFADPALTPVRYAFVTGDFIGSRPLVEIVVASFFVALTTVVIFFTGRLFLPDSYSAFLALIFAFATSAWSTASRALWQHGPSMLMLSLALYLLLTAQSRPWRVVPAAIPLALAYLLRPNNALVVAVISLYVARHYRRYLIAYLLCALPVGAAFLIFNESIYHLALPTYFSRRPPLFNLPHDILPMMQAALGALVSPSRGLLIYTPVFLFSIWGMIWARKTGWLQPLTGYLAAAVAGYWLLMVVYFEIWWAGHSYGPRYLSDVTPFLVFFLIPALMKWRESAKWPAPSAAAAFAVLLAASVFIHSRGALRNEVYLWNVSPVNVDQNPARVWDWRDPQFLR